MCSISVEPIPSMIRSPVASWKLSHTARGSVSPAETQRRRLPSAGALPAATIARYAVGAVDSTVAPCSAIASASRSGVARSSNRVAAPARNGKISSAPSPKVNASGGVPTNRSSGVGFSTCFENVSATASTSRWKCVVALGWPVVPEVKASSTTSSAAVGTAANGWAYAAARVVRSSAASPP